MDQFSIRKLEIEDVPSIVDIYEMITGETGPSEGELEQKMDYGDSMLCQGAELDGRLVGFIFGETRRGEFGETKPVGTIGLLGVHPDFQKLQVGRALGNELFQQFRGLGIKKIRTSVSNSDTSLLKFFMNLGLKPADSTILELKF